MFSSAWTDASNLTEDQINQRNKRQDLGRYRIFFLIKAINLAMCLADPKTDLAWDTTALFLSRI